MKSLIVLGIAGLLSAVYVFAVSPNAKADDCYSLEALKADVATHGDSIVGTLTYQADDSDTLVVIKRPTEILGVFLLNDCVTTVAPLDSIADSNPPDETPEGPNA